VQLLLAAICGGLVTVLAGTARIFQLRRAAKKNLAAGLVAGSQRARWFGAGLALVNGFGQISGLPGYPSWFLVVTAVDMIVLFGLVIFAQYAVVQTLMDIGERMRLTAQYVPPAAVEATGQPSAPSTTQAPSQASLPPRAGSSGDTTGGSRDGGRMSARAIFKPLPEIPEGLRRRNVELVAVARFRVAANGSALVELIEPTTDPELNRALLETLKRWRFFPAMQDGKPVASNLDIRIPISVK